MKGDCSCHSTTQLHNQPCGWCPAVKDVAGSHLNPAAAGLAVTTLILALVVPCAKAHSRDSM